jgi:hypothetical protein
MPVHSSLPCNLTINSIEFTSRSAGREAVAKALEEAFEDVTTINPDSLLFHSLQLFGYSPERQKSVQLKENILRFKEHFGEEPTTIATFLTDVKAKHPDVFRIKDALMTIYWLKCYGTERTISGPFVVGCLKRLRNTLKQYAKLFRTLKESKIVFGNFEEGDMFPYSVDGVHCVTGELRSFTNIQLSSK